MTSRMAIVAGCLVAALPFVQQQPVFRGRTGVVAVDVHVVDGSGRPVADLQAEDFTVTVDGRPRPIVAADYVSHGVFPMPASSRPTTAPEQPRVSSNVPSASTGPGRTVLLVVDESNIGAGNGRQAMRAAERFLAQLGPADRVGLALIPYGHANIDPTTDHAAVRQALQHVVGHFRPIRPEPPYNLGLGEAFAFVNNDRERWQEIVRRECEGRSPRGEDRLCAQSLEGYAPRMVDDARQRLVQSVRSLLALLTALARLPGPKTLILISEQLPVSSYMSEWNDFRIETSGIAAAAALAEASIYVLQLHTPLFDAENTPVTRRVLPPEPRSSGQRRTDIVDPTTEDAEIRTFGLQYVTSLTGGTRLMISGRPEAALDRIALEISAYYLLGVREDPADGDGRPHAIEVAVRRPNVQVRARKVFVIRSEKSAPVETRATELVNELLRTPAAASELPLAVTTYALPDPGEGPQNVRVIISAEIDRGVASDTAMAVGFVLLDADERAAGVSVEQIALTPVREQPDSPLCYLGAAIVPPGRYRIRLAAVDAKLRRGTVEHGFEARVTEVGDLRVSDLIIHDPHSTDKGETRPSVSAALRDTLTASLEVGWRAPGPPPGISVRLEVAAGPDGPALAGAEMTVQVLREERRLQAGGCVPLSGIPPGDYVGRAVVSVGAGPPTARVTRPFQIVPPTRP